MTSDDIEQACYAKGFLHITSHESDPLPAAVGLAVLEVLAREQLFERAAKMGAHLKAGLDELQQRHQIIGDVRGRGLLWGIEIVKDRQTREPDHKLGAAITCRCLELGLNMNIVNFPGLSSVWRIAPPLTVSTAEIDSALTTMDQAINACL